MKCVSSCFSCLCGTRNSSRISPSEPVQIIQPGSKEKYSVKLDSGEDSFRNGNVNPNFSLAEDDQTNGENVNVEDESESEYLSTLRAKALYIEVGKDRLLRVIHAPSDPDPPLPNDNGSPVTKDGSPTSVEKESDHDGSPSSSKDSAASASPEKKNEDGAIGGGGEDEEEEYWFSKWARKPRFRSIFAKNPDQRPKLHERNNNSMNNDENNKLSVEMEMARAAAAAKRRAWAYNNNGNCESTITQQPTVNPNDEEEFNSIAIVNSIKQHWMKEGSSSSTGSGNNSNSENSDANSNSSPCSTVEVQVSVERHSVGRSPASVKEEGLSNPAFEDDEDLDSNNEDEQLPGYNKTETTDDKNEQNTSTASTASNSQSTDSVSKGRIGSSSSSSSSSSSANAGSIKKSDISQQEEDAIISEPLPEEENNKTISSVGISSNNALIATPRKPLIFFIHSISGSSDVWRRQMEFFQQLGYEIVAPDLLGHGLSSTPLNPKYYYFESLVQDLVLIFDHFAKEDMKVVLIGHGYGACLAAMLTRVRLKNIALLITIAGGGPTPLVRRTCCQDSWFSWKCKLFHTNRIRGRFDNPELKHVLPPAIYRNVLSGQVWGDGDSSFYRRVTVPTLLVYGMRDKVVTLVEECEMERTIPKSFLELIDSAGHMVMLEEPEKLNKMLCKFIQSWS